MNREEYLKRLSFLLKDLPEEEIEDAIAYYEDYFEEAGEEKEEQVIKELGSPEKIARMIRDSVQGNQASSEYTEEGYRQETYEDHQHQPTQVLQTTILHNCQKFLLQFQSQCQKYQESASFPQRQELRCLRQFHMVYC